MRSLDAKWVRLAAVVVAAVTVVGLYLAAPRMAQVAPSASPGSPAATSTTAASPGTVLDDRFGFVSAAFARQPSALPDAVRRESDPRPTHDLADGLGSPRRTVIHELFGYGLAVTPDGRRLAYWTEIPDPAAGPFPRELQILDLVPGARPRTRVTLTPELGDVVGESVVWSSDGTGLVIGVGSAFTRCGADGPPCPPKHSALYLLEAAGGKPREIASGLGVTLVPVAWDRQARLVAAFEFEGPGSGRVLAYSRIEEGGTLKRTEMVIGAGGTVTVAASYDAKQVLAHEYASPGQVMHVWPLASPERSVVLTPRGEPVLAPARWRPGTAEIGVLFSGRLELWDVTGQRRSVPLPPPASGSDLRPFFFRPDGSAAFVGRYFQGPFVAIELATGRTAVVPGDEWLTTSVRVGS